jgi:hypothetical protein
MPFMAYNEAMPSNTTMRKIAEIAAEQWGLITRRQAEQAGIPERTLARLTAPGATLARVAHGVYLVAGSPPPDHVELRAAWLQLAPEVPVWSRTAEQGVVSHRSAAAIYGLGHLPADRQEFTLPHRRQVRRPDVTVHVRKLDRSDWIGIGGLPVTRPSRIASDLLWENEDHEAVARIVVDALRDIQDYSRNFVQALAPHASRLGFRQGGGDQVLLWLADIGGDPEISGWIKGELGRQEIRDGPAPSPMRVVHR